VVQARISLLHKIVAFVVGHTRNLPGEFFYGVDLLFD